MNGTASYQDLFEKYAKRDKNRNIATIISGAAALISLAVAVRRLRELQADRRTLTTA